MPRRLQCRLNVHADGRLTGPALFVADNNDVRCRARRIVCHGVSGGRFRLYWGVFLQKFSFIFD